MGEGTYILNTNKSFWQNKKKKRKDNKKWKTWQRTKLKTTKGTKFETKRRKHRKMGLKIENHFGDKMKKKMRDKFGLNKGCKHLSKELNGSIILAQMGGERADKMGAITNGI